MDRSDTLADTHSHYGKTIERASNQRVAIPVTTTTFGIKLVDITNDTHQGGDGRPPRSAVSDVTFPSGPLDQAFCALESVCQRCSKLFDQIRKACELDLANLNTILPKALGSAPNPPSADVAKRILVEAVLHLEEGLYTELISTVPVLETLRTEVSDRGDAARLVVEKVARVGTELRALPEGHAVVSFGDRLRVYAPAIEALRQLVVLRGSLAGVEEEPAADDLIRSSVPRIPDDRLLRQAVVAITLYERCEGNVPRAPALERVEPHPEGGDEHELRQRIPIPHEIDKEALHDAIATFVEDKDAATRILQHFFSEAEWLHLTRELFRTRFQLKHEELGQAEKIWTREELQDISRTCMHYDLPRELMKDFVISEQACAGGRKESQEWMQDLLSYAASLTLMERLVPFISPWRSPELFRSPEPVRHKMEHLSRIRELDDYEEILVSLAAVTRFDGFLSSFAQGVPALLQQGAPILLSYGFGKRSDDFKEGHSKFELEDKAFARYWADLKKIAPEVATPKVRVKRLVVACVLGLAVKTKLVERRSIGKGDLASFHLHPGIEKTELGSLLHRVVLALRTKNYPTAVSLLASSPAAAWQPVNDTGGQGLGVDPCPSTSERPDSGKIARDLAVVERAVDALRGLTKPHLIKRQVTAISSAHAQLRREIEKGRGLQDVILRAGEAADLLDLLKPPKVLGPTDIESFVGRATNAVNALRVIMQDLSREDVG